MKPIDFPQSTKVLQRPSNMTEKECSPLHVWSDGEQCVSCWKASFIERLKILFTGKVWLGVKYGATQPPVFITGERVFVKTSKTARFRAFFSKVGECITNTVKNVRDGFKQHDKRKHFIAGLIISFVVGIFIPWLGVLLGFIAGAAKEIWDKKGHGTPEWMDFVFTCLGAVSAFPFALIIHNLIW